MAELHPAQDSAERSAMLARIRKRDHDATHHCSAWREGAPLREQGCDDDGEPSGTAGAPMLRVLAGEELTDLLVVCIRWFGGTKLGTGGLVRAYTESVQGAVAEAKTQGLLEAVRILKTGLILVQPEQAHLPFAVLGAFPGAIILNQTFTSTDASLQFQIPPEQTESLETLWCERSRGGTITWME